MSFPLILPADYHPLLGPKDTERAIRLIKEFFPSNLAFELNLIRVTAPLIVEAGTGINDDLNGIERPVSFPVKAAGNVEVQIVQSLAKWKRMTLADLGFGLGEGLYTDMNALRPDEQLDNLHSLYVDQWDWERVISRPQRSLDVLRSVVRSIYDVMRRTEKCISYHYPQVVPVLPEVITFFHAEELQARYSDLEPREREYQVCREHGAVFVIGIGNSLPDGRPHDRRAPDYDDWSTPTTGGFCGLNGDILLYNPLLDCVFELSSMGIRVDSEALLRQLAVTGDLDRQHLLWHRRLLAEEFPLSIGGGIGQSRLCMFCLRKAHIGEIQASYWSDAMRRTCRQHDILLL